MPFGGIKGSERKRKRGPVFFYASIDLHVRLHKWRPSAEFLKLLKIIKKILFVLVLHLKYADHSFWSLTYSWSVEIIYKWSDLSQ